MSYDIRAMSISEILDTGFRLVRDQFAVLFPISLLSYLPIGVAFALMIGFIDPATGDVAELEADQIISMIAWGGGVILFLSAIFPLVWTAAMACAREAYLGRPVNFQESLRLGLAKYLHLVWVFTLFTLILCGFMLLAALAIGALASVVALSEIFNDGSVVAIVILVLLAVPALFGVGIWLYAMGFVMTVVSVAEERSAMDTIRRSWWLMMTAPGRTLGLSVVVYIIAMIASSGTQMLMNFAPLAGGLLWGAAQGIAFTYVVSTFVVYYYDVLCREEAFDLEHLAQRVEGEIPAEMAAPPPVAGG